MAVFTNQASLSYAGRTLNSNVATGEIVDVLEITKTAAGNYTPGEVLSYSVSMLNSGTTDLTGLTFSDDLGGQVGGGYPLTYKDGTMLVYVNGVLQPTPAPTAGPPLTLTGLTVPANGNVIIVYDAYVTSFANPSADGTLTNTAAVSGANLTNPVTAQSTAVAANEANLNITKSVTPQTVRQNGQLAFTFEITNTGNADTSAADAAVLRDTFVPALRNITVSYNGTPWTEGVDYTYNETTGDFETLPGRLFVQSAAFSQDANTVEWTAAPGIGTLTVSGTV